jgi:hypothetical protein
MIKLRRRRRRGQPRAGRRWAQPARPTATGWALTGGRPLAAACQYRGLRLGPGRCWSLAPGSDRAQSRRRRGLPVRSEKSDGCFRVANSESSHGP